MKIEMVDRRFGRLVVKEEAGRQGKVGHKQKLWRCQCDCGNIIVTRGDSLRDKRTRSCGCLHKEIVAKYNTKHGKHRAPIYNVWRNMLQRCNNPNNSRYADWGGRGITVCERWMFFENFLEDMGEKPKGLTIERIDNNKGYFPNNCEWATCSEQNRNRRANKKNLFKVKGVTWDKQRQKYQVHIGADHQHYNIGRYKTLGEAVIAREQAEQRYWGNE